MINGEHYIFLQFFAMQKRWLCLLALRYKISEMSFIILGKNLIWSCVWQSYLHLKCTSRRVQWPTVPWQMRKFNSEIFKFPCEQPVHRVKRTKSFALPTCTAGNILPEDLIITWSYWIVTGIDSDHLSGYSSRDSNMLAQLIKLLHT